MIEIYNVKQIGNTEDTPGSDKLETSECVPKLVGDLLINHVISATVAFPMT